MPVFASWSASCQSALLVGSPTGLSCFAAYFVLSEPVTTSPRLYVADGDHGPFSGPLALYVVDGCVPTFQIETAPAAPTAPTPIATT